MSFKSIRAEILTSRGQCSVDFLPPAPMRPSVGYEDQKTNAKKKLRNANEVRELWIAEKAHDDGSTID